MTDFITAAVALATSPAGLVAIALFIGTMAVLAWVEKPPTTRCRISEEWGGLFIGRRYCSTHRCYWDGGGPCVGAEDRGTTTYQFMGEQITRHDYEALRAQGVPARESRRGN